MGYPFWDCSGFLSAVTNAGGWNTILPHTTLFLDLYYCYYDAAPVSGCDPQFCFDYWYANSTYPLADGASDFASFVLSSEGVQAALNVGIPVQFEALGCGQGNPNATQFLADACAFCNTYNIGWVYFRR